MCKFEVEVKNSCQNKVAKGNEIETKRMIKTFPLNSRSKTTALKQPRELFSFARDIDGEWVNDDKTAKEDYLSYFYLNDSSIDKGEINLSAGYSTFKKIPEEQNVAQFGPYLENIIKYEKNNDGKKINVDIITYRGIMTKLLTLPYNLNDDISLKIIAFDGQLFIKSDDAFELNQRNQQQKEANDYVKKCEYSGYAFEARVTLPKPWAECSRTLISKRGKKIVNNYEQYISVVKTGMSNVGILLAGEVDCVWDYIPDGEDKKDNILTHYAELKTSKTIENRGQVMTFEKKLFKTWAQCFLLGISKVIYGFRDESFALKSVEVYKTEEIPILIKENPISQQQPNNNKIVCVNALKWYGALLEWLNTSIDKENEKVAYKLQYDSGSRTMSLIELSGEENKQLRNGELLTEEFKAWRRERKSA